MTTFIIDRLSSIIRHIDNGSFIVAVEIALFELLRGRGFYRRRRRSTLIALIVFFSPTVQCTSFLRDFIIGSNVSEIAS